MRKRSVRGVRKPAPIWKLVALDVLIFAVSLNVFALFHHVLPRRGQEVGIVSERVASGATPVPDASFTPMPAMTAAPESAAPESSVEAVPASTAEPTATPEPTPESTPEPVGYFGTKFADKFTDGAVEASKKGYQSANINIEFNMERFAQANCYIANIYIRDISSFKTVLARDTFGVGYAESLRKMAERTGSILTMNGDYYGTTAKGVVIRNGRLYRSEWSSADVCVLYWDGTMETFNPNDFNSATEMNRGAYQAWNFGPMLLDSQGNAKTKFNSTILGRNPRTALGYYEPGHYCFVVADGRSGDSHGLTMQELSELMHRLGCKRAYNMDGGQSTQMLALTTTIDKPYHGGRPVSDALIIVEP